MSEHLAVQSEDPLPSRYSTEHLINNGIVLKHEPAGTLGELVGPPLKLTDPQYFLQNYLTSDIDGEGHVLGKHLSPSIKSDILALGRFYEQSGSTKPLQDLIDDLRAFEGSNKFNQKTFEILQDYINHLRLVAPEYLRREVVDTDELAQAS